MLCLEILPHWLGCNLFFLPAELPSPLLQVLLRQTLTLLLIPIVYLEESAKKRCGLHPQMAKIN